MRLDLNTVYATFTAAVAAKGDRKLQIIHSREETNAHWFKLARDDRKAPKGWSVVTEDPVKPVVAEKKEQPKALANASTITANERRMLEQIRDSQYHDGRFPVNSATWTFEASDGFNWRAAGGTMASLVRKGMVWTDGESCAITRKGFDAVKDSWTGADEGGESLDPEGIVGLPAKKGRAAHAQVNGIATEADLNPRMGQEDSVDRE